MWYLVCAYIYFGLHPIQLIQSICLTCTAHKSLSNDQIQYLQQRDDFTYDSPEQKGFPSAGTACEENAAPTFDGLQHRVLLLVQFHRVQHSLRFTAG